MPPNLRSRVADRTMIGTCGRSLAKRLGNRRAEFSGPEVIIQHCDIDLMQLRLSLLNGISWNDLVTLLAKYR